MASCKECIHHDLCFDNGTLFIHFTAIGREKENVETNCPFKKFKSIVDVVEVKHGKWKVKRDDYDTQFIKCSVCKEEFYSPDNCFDFDFVPNYCMNCGAKMEVPEC